jgi:hypothetical protein
VRPRGRPGRLDYLHGIDRHPKAIPVLPLRHHFEQNFHVRHRLDRYGAGCTMDFELATPEMIAEAIAQEI